MYLSPDRQTALLLPPRTASRTIATVAKTHGYTLHRDHHGIDPTLTAQATTRIVAIRNPYDALASWYSQQRNATAFPTFSDWLDAWIPKVLDPAQRQDGIAHYVHRNGYFHRWLTHNPTHLIRYELLVQDLPTHFPNLDPSTIPHVTDHDSTRADRPYRGFYSPEDLERVAQILEPEATNLGYSF